MTKAEFTNITSKPECKLHQKGRDVCEAFFVDGKCPSEIARNFNLHRQSVGEMIKKFRKLM
jgi:predicted DNA-binding protein YlxM (UPF0122 family)